jgi:hypothetical protein
MRTTNSIWAIILCGLGTALSGCEQPPHSDERPAAVRRALVASTPTPPPRQVSCPTGIPKMQVINAQTLSFECPDGSKPTVVEVAGK